MFTNWLTDTTGLTNCQLSVNSVTTRLSESNNNNISTVSDAKLVTASTGLSLLSGHSLTTNLNSNNLMSTPPDIVLEVGPTPATVRFMAHSLVLGMHSGYLRSAIRLDESGANATDTIIYLTNVTPEQFAPLLTYMYTGYLDLNVENIFAVLLATHVLHMPRALEICRSYLARAQTEGFFGSNNTAVRISTNPIPPLPPGSGKIIRPIASKPQLTNFGFLSVNHQPLTLNPLATNTNITTPTTTNETKSNNSTQEHNKNEEDDDIEVDEVDEQSLNNENQIPITDEEEDVEVFIDSNSEAEVVIETHTQKLSFRNLMGNKQTHNEKNNKAKDPDKIHHKKSLHHNRSERRKKKAGSSGLQVAKAPIPASQLDGAEANKVIIDVASCDGPVRFKRVLNTAYGHKPDDALSSTNSPAAVSLAGPVMPERSLQSVSLSFHQQMAKTISQQQQLQQTEESENSETSNGSMGAPIRAAEKSTIGGNRKTHSEVFICVYCKHTFKSQYCYQKHAKRHLNPLTLQATCVPDSKAAPKKEETSMNGELQITKHQNTNPTRQFYTRNTTNTTYSTTSSALAAANSNPISSSSDYLRREVRPLDMNVQYYPCKTCGCKFPSYYFVHKHRKMCHAEEESQTGNSDNTAVAASALGSADCLNSQSSD